MVAKISYPKNVDVALRYQENKIKAGKGTCLTAGGYLREAGEMNSKHKLEGLRRYHYRNERAKKKILHVSLNFDPSEKLSEEKLTRIAGAYLQKMGLENQPYLVYRHDDTAHLHIHILANLIREDGKRIYFPKLIDPLRKEIEIEFGLKKVEEALKYNEELFLHRAPERVEYGKCETKRAIEGVVTAVLSQYHFTSLPEFNAALRPFNVTAYRGKEGSKTFENGGLLYFMTDELGNFAGAPLKASVLAGRPTLKALEKKFEENELQKATVQLQLKGVLDRIRTAAPSLESFKAQLSQNGVLTFPHWEEKGKPVDLFFVDQRTKSVVRGQDLGMPYDQLYLQQDIYSENRILSPAPSNQKIQGPFPSKKESRDLQPRIMAQGLLNPNEGMEAHSPALLEKKRWRKTKKL